jgi:nitrite reductase/ring-hydroxylating ferredoxin subunit
MWYFVLNSNCLLDNSGQQIEVHSVPLAIFRLQGKLYAFQAYCPHRMGRLGVVGLLDHPYLICSLHNWKFELQTGKNLQTSDHLRTYPIRESENQIWVQLEI